MKPSAAAPLRIRWLAVLLAAAALCARAEAIPPGPGQAVLDIAGTPIEIYTYKPPAYDGGPLLLVLHGLGRNAPGYRDYARVLADRLGLLVVAPRFDRERFPTWRYQAGGITRDTGDRYDGEVRLEPESRWMGAVFAEIVATVRRMEQAPALPYSVLGHSAGGQTLSRYAAFVANDAQRIVIANPSTWLWPAREIRFPFGYGGLPAALADEAALRRYLAQPIVVLLGTADVRQGPDLNVRPGAMQQGENRYARGLAFFRTGEHLARERGWDFGWRLVEVPGVGHSARRMFAAEQTALALTP